MQEKKVKSRTEAGTAQAVVVTGKAPYEVVAVAAMSRISFGKYPTRKARALAAAMTASPRVILEIERWFALSGTSELHLSRTPIG